MKNTLSTLLISAVILASTPATAGTFYAGVKGWATLWDSGALGMYQARIKDGTSGITAVSREFGKGTMAGPLLGFRSQDKKWEINTALMVFSSFSQEMEADGYDDINTRDFTVSFDMEMKRRDLDASVSYAILPFMKVYAGYGHQYYKLELEGGYTDETFSRTWKEKYRANVAMPAGGVILFHTLSRSMFMSLKLGVLYAFPTIEVDMYDVDTGNSTGSRTLPVDNSPGFTSEAAVGFTALKNIIMQAGYRFQSFRYRWTENSATWDNIQGVTLSACYMF